MAVLDEHPTSGRIGPNAILQLLPVMDAFGGREMTAELLRAAGIGEVPDGSEMVDESVVARLHQALRRDYPGAADRLAAKSGRATADYIIANRIPGPVCALLRLLPATIAEGLLLSAITRHAWTFAGSGTFTVTGRRPTRLTLQRNPIVRGEHSDQPVCAWHCAVFQRLYDELVGPGFHVREVACEAAGAKACRFEL